MSDLVQIHREGGVIGRVPRGNTPVVQLHLEPHQRVISIDLRPDPQYRHEEGRKTVDWTWIAYIETRLAS